MPGLRMNQFRGNNCLTIEVEWDRLPSDYVLQIDALCESIDRRGNLLEWAAGDQKWWSPS